MGGGIGVLGTGTNVAAAGPEDCSETREGAHNVIGCADRKRHLRRRRRASLGKGAPAILFDRSSAVGIDGCHPWSDRDQRQPLDKGWIPLLLGCCDNTDVMLRYNGHWTESARRLRNSGAVLATGVLLVVAGAGIAHLDEATLGGFLMGLGPSCLAGAYAVWVGQRERTKQRIMEDAERWLLHDRLNDIAGVVDARILVAPVAMENELLYRANMLAHWAGLDEYRDDFPYAPIGPRDGVGGDPTETEGPSTP